MNAISLSTSDSIHLTSYSQRSSPGARGPPQLESDDASAGRRLHRLRRSQSRLPSGSLGRRQADQQLCLANLFLLQQRSARRPNYQLLLPLFRLFLHVKDLPGSSGDDVEKVFLLHRCRRPRRAGLFYPADALSLSYACERESERPSRLGCEDAEDFTNGNVT